ncbi:insulin-like 5a [Alosa sapidissima]|uniref:insulin-like 5a n=1 Tax=Alosa sapidissima TaxID=34773 RepID=UPI001C0A332D|nr:insulin-like 5a [Alosa sapidissima]
MRDQQQHQSRDRPSPLHHSLTSCREGYRLCSSATYLKCLDIESCGCIMRARSLPVLAVLLLCALCTLTEVRGDMKAVKLCGREFIRAVVYTCGGSRWRRLLNQRDLEGMSGGEQSSMEGQGDSLASDLSKRDLNHVLTNMCCQMGCRKSDLTYLC